MATATVPENLTISQPESAPSAPDGAPAMTAELKAVPSHPAPPKIDPDALLAVGFNMAEAAHALVCCFGWTKGTPEVHPFYAKLSEAHCWLDNEGWRPLQDTPAATIKGIATKASAMRLRGGYEIASNPLIEDLERMAEAAPEPTPLTAVSA